LSRVQLNKYSWSSKHVIVFANVELAHWTGTGSLQQPLIDTIGVEKVQAGHGSNIFCNFILHEAYHTFFAGFIPIGNICSLTNQILLSDQMIRKCLYDCERSHI
jgi:hypothetical protein